MKHHTPLFTGQTSRHPLTGRAFVLIFCGDVTERIPAELAPGLVVRRTRVRHIGNDAVVFTGLEFLAAVVAAIGHHAQFLYREGRLGLLRHAGELTPVTADVGDLVRHDQVMPGIDCRLHVVAHQTAPAMIHRAGIGVGQ